MLFFFPLHLYIMYSGINYQWQCEFNNILWCENSRNNSISLTVNFWIEKPDTSIQNAYRKCNPFMANAHAIAKHQIPRKSSFYSLSLFSSFSDFLVISRKITQQQIFFFSSFTVFWSRFRKIFIGPCIL